MKSDRGGLRISNGRRLLHIRDGVDNWRSFSGSVREHSRLGKLSH